MDWHCNNAWSEPAMLNQCYSQAVGEGSGGPIGGTCELVKLSSPADHEDMRCSNTMQITEHAT